MKKILLLIAWISLVLGSNAQPYGMGGVNWMPDGNSYTSVEKYSIVKTELPAMAKTVLFDLDKIFPKDESHPRSISSYAMSKDMKQVLLKINTKTQYHKITGEVWVYDAVSGKITQMGKSLKPDALMYPKFSPECCLDDFRFLCLEGEAGYFYDIILFFQV